MTMDKITPHTEVVAVEFKNFLDGLDNLSDEQKKTLISRLVDKQKTPVTIVLGGNNVINNSFAIQANGGAEKVAEQLENMPPELVSTLMEAIAIWTRQQNP